MAICHVCSHYENHKKHTLKPLKEMLAEQDTIIKETRERIGEVINSIEMSFFKMNLETLQTQKELYLEKLKNDFTVMHRMLDRKFVEIYAKIVRVFEECVDESEHQKSGFQAYLTRLHYIKSFNA